MELFNGVLNLVGSTLYGLGLDSPMSRALGFGTVGFATQYVFRPSISYVTIADQEGKKKYIAKPCTLFASKNNDIPTTYFVWYLWPLLFAIFGAFFL